MEVVKHFHPGEVIIREGDRSDGFYILQSGRLDVFKDRRKVAEIYEPGSLFGEMAGLLDTPRTCTVIARVSSYVIPIPKNIEEVVSEYPTIAAKLLRTLAKRLEDATDQEPILAPRIAGKKR